MRTVACLSLALGVAAATNALANGRVAVVAMPEGQWMRLYIAYPPGVSSKAISEDLSGICAVGRLRIDTWHSTVSAASVVVVCRVQPAAPAHSNSIPIWPFVYALRRFNEIAIAYVGAARPGSGSAENAFVRVQWTSTATGINYRVMIKRRDFAGLSDLTAGITSPVEATAPAGGGSSAAATVALVVLLALLAAAVTYWSARKILAAPAATARPQAK